MVGLLVCFWGWGVIVGQVARRWKITLDQTNLIAVAKKPQWYLVSDLHVPAGMVVRMV